MELAVKFERQLLRLKRAEELAQLTKLEREAATKELQPEGGRARYRKPDGRIG